jgi:hypothetical protein
MPVTINGNGAITGLSITTADLANGAVTTAKIADANVTIAKISATGTPSSTTFLRGDGSWQTAGAAPTTAQVLSATAGASVGAVGTYAFLGLPDNSTLYVEGATAAGSSLVYSSAYPASGFQGGNPAGTWRCMGYIPTGTNQVGARVTVWLRIS